MLLLPCYDHYTMEVSTKCVTFIISSLVIGKLDCNNVDHCQPVKFTVFKRFQQGETLFRASSNIVKTDILLTPLLDNQTRTSLVTVFQ